MITAKLTQWISAQVRLHTIPHMNKMAARSIFGLSIDLQQHTHPTLLHAQNFSSGAEMLTPVRCTAAVAGAALLPIFIAALYLTALLLLSSNSDRCLFIHHFSKPGSSQGNEVKDVGVADIVWPSVYVC